jgi:hypothetical protein
VVAGTWAIDDTRSASRDMREHNEHNKPEGNERAASSDAAGLTCATCASALDGDPDEDPTGDAGMPICGECARERDFFVLDVSDGELDGAIDR